jgi:hypothetical protein
VEHDDEFDYDDELEYDDDDDNYFRGYIVQLQTWVVSNDVSNFAQVVVDE